MLILRSLRYLAMTALLYCLAVVIAAPLTIAPAPLPVAPLPSAVPEAAPAPVQPIAIITQPQAKAILKGTVRVMGTVTGVDGITYAILYVDGSSRSITNGLPMRFELDTTRFADGKHVLKVEAFDGAGSLAITPSVPVFIKNKPQVYAVPISKAPVKTPVATKAPAAPKPATTVVVPIIQPKVSYTTPQPERVVPVPVTQPTVTYAAPTPKPVVTAVPVPTAQPTVSYAVPTPAPVPVAVPAPTTQPTVAYTTWKPTSRKLAVLIDGKPVAFEAAPYITGGRVMVVLRTLVEHTGGVIAWNHNAKQATAIYADHHYIVTPAQRDVMKDGVPTALPEVVALNNGHLYIPAAAWRQLFGGTVAYDNVTRMVYLRTTAAQHSEQAAAK
jgi:hypothetical protein